MTLEVMSPTAALLDGRYILHDRVGRGGMATVYRAEDTHLGRTVAIKMLHEGEGAATSADRAHNEKMLLASVSHPALVTLFDAQLEPRRPQYLVMEYIDGPTLADRMSAGPLPPRQVARLARDLAQGLATVHAAGIVHRDVKPSNVLLARDQGGSWTAKLADFGIACSLDSTSRLTSPGIVLGTLTYMAPEQLRDAEPGTPVDIFSLGLVLVEALTGDPGYPAIGTGRAAAVARLLNPPTISEKVSDEWRGLLERMTQLEPEARPTASEVARAARELMKTSPSATGESPGAGEASGAGSAVAASAAPTPRTDSERTTRVQRTAPAATDDSPSDAPRRGIRRGAIAGAAALVAVAAITTGFATASTPVAGISRDVSTTMIRTVVPAETVTTPTTDPAQEVPAEPVVPVVPAAEDSKGDNGNSGNSGKDKPGKSDNSGNSGNSGKGKNEK